MKGHRIANPVPFTLRRPDGISLYDRLVTLEKDWGAAGDPDFSRQQLATDACMVFGPTGILDRDATIEALAQSLPWDTYRLEDRPLRMSETSVALIYRGYGTRAGHDYAALITSVFVDEGGRWKLALHQHTSLNG